MPEESRYRKLHKVIAENEKRAKVRPDLARAEVVERLCDRVALIHDGKLATSGTMTKPRTRPETPRRRVRPGGGVDHPAETVDEL